MTLWANKKGNYIALGNYEKTQQTIDILSGIAELTKEGSVKLFFKTNAIADIKTSQYSQLPDGWVFDADSVYSFEFLKEDQERTKKDGSKYVKKAELFSKVCYEFFVNYCQKTFKGTLNLGVGNETCYNLILEYFNKLALNQDYQPENKKVLSYLDLIFESFELDSNSELKSFTSNDNSSGYTRKIKSPSEKLIELYDAVNLPEFNELCLYLDSLQNNPELNFEIAITVLNLIK